MPEHFPRVPTSEMISQLTTVEPTVHQSKCRNIGRESPEYLTASSNETLELFPYSESISMKPSAESDSETALEKEEKIIFINTNSISIEKVDEPIKVAQPNCIRSSLGVVLGLTSGLTNSLVALLVKVIETIGTFEIAVFRYVVMLIPLVVTLGWRRMNPFQLKLIRQSGWALVLRAIVGAASTYCKYFALRKLPLADASVILFSSPVFASILARIFLKEPFDWVHGGAIFLSLCGCALVARPTFIFGSVDPAVDWYDYDHLFGCLLALASAVFTASVFVTVRHMKQVDNTIILFWTAFVGLGISLVATAAADSFKFPTDPWEISYIIGVGILTLISQEALTRALKLESAGLISLLRTGDIVWAFIWQMTLFRIVPHYFSIIGAFLVVFCVLFISLREVADKLPPDSKLGIAMRRVNRAVDAVSCRCCLCCRKTQQQQPSV